MKQKKVIVVGGGFGGFKAVKGLLKKGFEVTLISENEYFYFTPLLVEVVVRTLNFRDVSLKFSDYFKSKNFTFILGQVDRIDFENNLVHVGSSEFSYDYIVVSTGSRRRTLPMKGHDLGLPLKNLKQAEVLRERLFREINSASEVLHVSVIGAGASGIELAFAVDQLAHHCKKFPRIEINVFDSGDKLLPKWNPRVGQRVVKLMKKKGIHLHLNSVVKEVGNNFIITDKGRHHSDLTILTLGVVPNSSMIPAHYLDENKYIKVDDFLKIVGLKNAFALGDVVKFDKILVPKLAQTAQNQGILAAKNITRLAQGKSLKKYSATILGNVLTLGSRNSITTVKNMMFAGVLGNIMRAGAYIYKMPGLSEKMELARSWILHTLFKVNLK